MIDVVDYLTMFRVCNTTIIIVCRDDNGRRLRQCLIEAAFLSQL